jgi:hypothetical protein
MTLTDFGSSNCLREVSARLQELDAKVSKAWLATLKSALQWSTGKICKERVPLGLTHRDFTPWNTFLADGRLFVFDWEYGRRNWPPLLDALHFVIQKGVLVNHESALSLWAKLFSTDSREALFISTLSSRLGLRDSLFLPLFAFYLCDVATLYLQNYQGSEEIERQAQPLLECWEGLLTMILTRQ